jgi:hypothetical protein
MFPYLGSVRNAKSDVVRHFGRAGCSPYRAAVSLLVIYIAFVIFVTNIISSGNAWSGSIADPKQKYVFTFIIK